MADKTKLKMQDRTADSIDETELDDDDAHGDAHGPALTAAKGRPTLSRREMEESDEPKGNFLQRTGRRLGDYFEGVRSELQKVTWPSREDLRRLMIIVVIALIISSIILGSISLGFTELFKVGLDNPILLLGFMAIAIAIGVVWNRRQARRSSGL